MTITITTLCHFAECHCYYAECHHAECHCAVLELVGGKNDIGRTFAVCKDVFGTNVPVQFFSYCAVIELSLHKMDTFAR